MQASDVIETYIGDTVRFLPRAQRKDVAVELRSLLTDELRARGATAGRPNDSALALDLVRDYGQPSDVAARYSPPLTVIDAADTVNFLRAAVIGALTLIVLAFFRRLGPDAPTQIDRSLTFAILTWTGLLTVVCGIRSSMRRRRSAIIAWKPLDRDRISRLGTAVLVPVALAFIYFYSSPATVISPLTRGRLDVSWANYTPELRQAALPCFLGLMIALLAVRSFAAWEGRWRRLTRRIDIALNLSLALLLLGLSVRGHIFPLPAADQVARDILALVGVIYLSGVGIDVFNELGRTDRPVAIPS